MRADGLVKMIIRAALRWMWLLLICLMIGAGSGLLAQDQFPPMYAATSLVQLDAPPTKTSQVIQPLGVYATLVTSDSILRPVLGSFSLEDQRRLASRQLTVSSDIPTQTISIRVVLKYASLASSFVNALAQTLVAQQNALIIVLYARDFQAVKDRLDTEQHMIERLDQRYAQIPATHTTELQQLDNEIALQQNLENQDFGLQQNLQTEQALIGTPFSLLQRADLPSLPVSPLNRIPLMPLALCLGLLAGCVMVGQLEKRLARIYDPALLQARTGLAVLGALRWMPRLNLPDAFRAAETLHGPLLEDGRMLLADTLLLAEETQASVLALTSLRTGAGSSTVAWLLANLLAQCRRNVLLIDANFYHPSLHMWAEKPSAIGLAELLEAASAEKIGILPGAKQFLLRDPARPSINRYLFKTPLPTLYLLLAGTATRDPATLLGMPELPQILHMALQTVDFVIIDCPPLTHAEVHLLAAFSDQILLVVNAARDRMPQVEQAKHTLSLAGIKAGGLIVTQLGRWL